MRMLDILEKKKLGQELTEEEIGFFVAGYTAGSIPDYQAAALLMAIRLRGMSPRETVALTLAMADSGERSDLSFLPGRKVDKHSTGGVGDKTTLIVGPMVAALGVPVAKMSGRGLGHTGGTLDKLESIPGFRISLPREDFVHNVQTIGISLIGQTGNLAPADKKLYALRDVTATVDSLPLIASSIMSKKLASGADAIVLDVKCGSGAFMKTLAEAHDLAQQMVDIGRLAGKETLALVTNMDRPLGHAVGNSLEVQEAIQTLRGQGPQDLTDLCIELAAAMLHLGQKGSLEDCRRLAAQTLVDGSALEKFRQLIQAQGGDERVLEDFSHFPRASKQLELRATESAYLQHMDSQRCGTAAMVLGAGRATKEDSIDHAAGLVLAVEPGAFVEQGQLLATLYTNDGASLSPAAALLQSALAFSMEKPQPQPLIYELLK